VIKDIERMSLKENIRAVYAGGGAVSPAIAAKVLNRLHTGEELAAAEPGYRVCSGTQPDRDRILPGRRASDPSGISSLAAGTSCRTQSARMACTRSRAARAIGGRGSISLVLRHVAAWIRDPRPHRGPWSFEH
jgi:hypothetical protein